MLAVTGIFDMPKRTGTTEYNWGTSIEPFVDAEDIELDGRTLSLKLCIKSQDYADKLDELRIALQTCTALGTDFGSFDVICKDAVSVEIHPSSMMAVITARLWQQTVFFPKLEITPSANISSTALDGYSLDKDFGIYIGTSNGLGDLAKRIDVNTTLPYTHAGYRESQDISFSCKMLGNSPGDLYYRICQFESLLAKPGLRSLVKENISAKVYFKDGLTARLLSPKILGFDLKCRVAEWIQR